MTGKRRCAIYTRTSSEEGLAQDFNSLHAQAEACQAYVRSQAGEGWREAKTYVDGGLSGGSMERPALKALLADIAAKRLDIVVVYKVDRLTRSLADFAKIVEIMDATQVSFVSVTQAFNTTTSMGRLTLNVLLSFAQFEREVTGERIRDKIAASKAKGMWMGGNPPLGYEVKNRSLIVNEAEAETVRFIFRRFLEVGSVHGLMRDLESRGVRTKARVGDQGDRIGGVAFNRGGLYWLLGNPLYRGLVSHKGKLYPGLHEAIVEQELWDEAQALRARLKTKQKERHASGTLLMGRVFDDRGNPMAPTHTQKGAKRYRYYVSTAVTRGRPERAGSVRRVAAAVLDRAVIDAAKPMLAPNWEPECSTAIRVRNAATRIELSEQALTLDLRREAIAPGAVEDFDPGAERLRIVRPFQFARPRNSTVLVGAGPEVANPDRALIRALAMAHVWMRRLDAGQAKSIAALAKAEGLCPIHTARLLPLAFLAPDLTARILEGRQPRTMTLTALTAEPLPLGWDEQRARFRSFL